MEKTGSSYIVDQEISKLTVYVLTRDLRIDDNLTLFKAYDEAIKSKTHLAVIFRFTDQINPEQNPFYSKNAVQFMLEALEDLSKQINISFIEHISDEEWLNFLNYLPIHKIFIARDFSPYARKRYDMYSKVAETLEIDDITVYPITTYKTFEKLSQFVEYVRNFDFPKIQTRNINWKDETVTKFLENMKFNYNSTNCDFIKHSLVMKGKFSSFNLNLKTIPRDLKKILEDLNENLKGYSNKKIRDLIGKPRVSYISSFLKFGLISIRVLHAFTSGLKCPSQNDISFYQRELFFRDFYYSAAFYKYDEVFEKPKWEESNPRFILEEDLMKWKAHKNLGVDITNEEREDIKAAKLIYDKWSSGRTEYGLINAGILELVNTGYMLNKTRILATSYLTRDNRLWWKYAEKFYANHLTDYDWTINSISHQNIAKIGYYPNKNVYDFSIEKQQMINPEDKEEYYDRNNRCINN